MRFLSSKFEFIKIKMGKIYIILLTLFFVLNNASYAQSERNFTGVVLSSDAPFIANAMLVLRDSLNKKTYKVYYSDRVGKFNFSINNNKVNMLLIFSMGYKQKEIPLSSSNKNLKVFLQKDSAVNLGEVVIKGKRSPLKIETDRLVYNMKTNPAKNDNALEALKYIPFIASDGEHFSIIGKSETKVYVNGVPKKLSSDALNDYLKALPADRIKSIEVIHSPNSTFRGDGNFGIINIVLKKMENEGVQGNISAQIWKTHYMKERGNINLIFHRNKWTVNALLGGANHYDWKEENMTSFMKSTYTKTVLSSLIKGSTREINGNIDWDYELSRKDKLGGGTNFSYSKLDWKNRGEQKQIGNNTQLLNVKHKNNLGRNITDAGFNMFYEHRSADLNKTLNIDMDYVFNRNKQIIWNRMDNIDARGDILSPYNYYKENVPQNSHIASTKIEYNAKVGNDGYTIGIDSYYSNIDNKNIFLQNINGTYINDEAQSNDFALKEWTSALFMGWNKSWNNFLSTRLGSRVEYTSYKTEQYTLHETDKSSFVRFLPNFYVRYRLSDKHILSYIFSNRIKRPSFYLFNPFKVYTSATSYTTGNSQLKPEIMYGQTFQYQFFKNYILQLSYQKVKHQVYELTYSKDDDIQITTPVNAGNFEYFMAVLNTNTSYMKGLAYLNASVSYIWQKLHRGNFSGIAIDGYSNGVWGVDLNNNFTLSRKRNISFDVNISYNTKDISFYVETPEKLYLYGQLKKRFKAFQVALYAFCNLYHYDGKVTTKWRNIYNTINMQRISIVNGEPLGIGIRFNCTFGNQKTKGMSERNGAGSEAKKRL